MCAGRHSFMASAASAAPPAPALAAGPRFSGLRLRGRSCNRQLLKDRFLLSVIAARSGLRHALLSKFRDDRFESSYRLSGSFGRSGGCRGDWRAQASEGLLGLLLPLRPAKAFCGGRVPTRSFGMLSGFLVDSRQLERDHRVARAFEQSCQLS